MLRYIYDTLLTLIPTEIFVSLDKYFGTEDSI